MKGRLAVGLVLAAVALPILASAQGPASLASLQVALWPEYDRQAVLVILQAQLPADSPLPTSISLPMPASAGEPHAVANASPDGGLVNARYERSVSGDWAQISIEAESTAIWLEYYDELTTDGRQRSFTYLWPGTIGVETFGYEVQQPLGASALAISPPAPLETTDNQGLTIWSADLGSLAVGQEQAIEVSYARALDGLTVALLDPSTVSLTPPETLPSGWALPAIVAGLGLAGVGAYWFVRRRPAKHRARPRRSPKAVRKNRFCHQCGAQAQAADRFCRQCGTELRR